MVCEIDGDSKSSNRGAEVKFTLAPIQYGRRRIQTGSKYEGTLSASFKVCKCPELYDENHMAITGEEFRALERWLNRREFLWFHSYDHCNPEIEGAWFRATFTLSKYEIGGVTYAVEMDMQTDSPFGYGDEHMDVVRFSGEDMTHSVLDMNDEIGAFYPDVRIQCLQMGDLTLTNETTGSTFSVDHCSVNEIIEQHGEAMILTTSLPDTHDIANDFNYEWFVLKNSYAERENIITASLPCELTIKYRPIIKETI